MEYVISALWLVLESVALVLFASAFLPYRHGKKRSTFTVCVMCAVFLLMQLLERPALLARLCALALSLCFVLLLFQGQWVQLLLIGLLDYIMFSGMDTIVLFGASAVLQISVDDLVWRKGMYTVLVTAGKLLSVFLAWLVRRLHPLYKAQRLDAKWILLISIFPVTSLFMMISLFLICREQHDLSRPVLLFCVFLGIANVAIVYVVSLIERDTEMKQRNNMLSQQMELQTASILTLEKAYRQQRKRSHDFQNHLCTISELLDNESYEAATKYVHELSQAQTNRIMIVNTHHPIIDAILNQKYQMAVESQIEMRFQFNDLSGVTLTASELVVLLSNLLDNAIEACRRMERDRQILCTMLKSDSIFLSVRNTSLPVDISARGIVTTKKPANEHGYGLSGVCRVLDSLHAEYTYDYENGWFQFTAEIPA